MPRHSRADINGSALDGAGSRVWLSRAEGPVVFGRRGTPRPLAACTLTGTFRTTSVDGVAMVEHLFAALGGLGLHRGVSIEVEGAALPFLDGSARRWTDALAALGIAPSPARLRVAREESIDVEGSRATFAPSDHTRVEVELADLPHAVASSAAWDGTSGDFLSRIALARSFFFESDVDEMLRGGVRAEIDPACVVVVTEGGLVSSGTAPDADEPARHKLLDLLGDLYFWGGPPIGKTHIERPGHAANHALVRAAMAHGILVLTMLVIASTFAIGEAHAQERLERPPTLPELTHRYADIGVEHTFAGIALGTPPRQTSVALHRISFDVPLVPGQWFLSGAWGFTLGSAIDGRVAGAPTNTEIGLRGVWSSTTGLGFGGGIALVIPTTSVATGSTSALMLGEGAAVRAWDRPLFEPETFALRPFVDLRTVTGHFTLQFRQMLDMIASGRSALPLEESYRVAAVALVYVGYRIVDWLAAGAEIAERYDMDSATPDADRPRFAFTGSLRVVTRWFQPGIAVTTGLGSPLNALGTIGAPFERSPTSFVALRIGLVFTGFDPPW